MATDVPRAGTVALASGVGRMILATTVLGSALAMLTATVVNVALPALAEDLGATSAEQTWILNAYLLVVAALILLGGRLGDLLGRKRVFLAGTTWFAAASVLCALAPDPATLIALRALQGVGAALLTPGSLAILQSSIRPQDRGRAVGAWAGLGGVAAAVGPLLGGWVVEVASWRWVFVLNLPLAVLVVALGSRCVPETRDDGAGRLDLPGAALTVAALGTFSFAVIEGPVRGPGPLVGGLVVAGVLAAALVAWERRTADPMIPLEVFANRQFTGANAVTFVVYGGFGAVFFLVAVYVQVVEGLSPTAAGAALLPVTALVLVLSPVAGSLTGRIGPRRMLTAGPLVMAAGLSILAAGEAGAGFVRAVLPGMVVFGVGLATIVAPVTSTALDSLDDRRAGIASGVNNAVSRVAGAIAVAALPALAGLTGEALSDPDELTDGFPVAMRIAASVVAAGGVLAWFVIRDPAPATEGVGAAEGFTCPVDGAPVHLADAPGA